MKADAASMRWPSARTLGWSEVVVIDDDLGVSAGGVARPGFQRLLAAICAGQVGAVVSIEASRLARNGRDWHTLRRFTISETRVAS
jgi:DNA invertase Pin-like site-specific DNA recombinase